MFVIPQNNSGNLSNYHMVIKQRFDEKYDEKRNLVNVLCIVLLRRKFKSNNIFVSYRKRETFRKFRTCNHKLPIEVGRYTNTPRINRICHFCNNNTLCDEFQPERMGHNGLHVGPKSMG